MWVAPCQTGRNGVISSVRSLKRMWKFSLKFPIFTFPIFLFPIYGSLPVYTNCIATIDSISKEMYVSVSFPYEEIASRQANDMPTTKIIFFGCIPYTDRTTCSNFVFEIGKKDGIKLILNGCNIQNDCLLAGILRQLHSYVCQHLHSLQLWCHLAGFAIRLRVNNTC